jgi:hypothetical protein
MKSLSFMRRPLRRIWFKFQQSMFWWYEIAQSKTPFKTAFVFQSRWRGNNLKLRACFRSVLFSLSWFSTSSLFLTSSLICRKINLIRGIMRTPWSFELVFAQFCFRSVGSQLSLFSTSSSINWYEIAQSKAPATTGLVLFYTVNCT